MTNVEDFPFWALPKNIRGIVEDIHKTVDPDTNNNLTQLLRSESNRETIEKVAQLLSHSDPDVRCLAVRVLLLQDSEVTLGKVIPLLKDPVWYVRLCVCEELFYNNCTQDQLVDPLIELLNNEPESDTRASAMILLGVIGDERAIPVLENIHKNDQGLDYEGTPVSHIAKTILVEWKAKKAPSS